MAGFDWNGNGKKDSFDHYMDMKVTSNSDDEFKSTNGGNGGNNGGCGKFGCGWIAIVVVVIMLISFIGDGASWVAIDRLLGFGLLAFLFLRWISTQQKYYTSNSYIATQI